MLQIRLNKGPSSDGGSGVKSLPAETVTVACPDHLVLADLPVAKGLGSATSAARVKTVGRRSRRQLGERVHFCVRCDYPIAIYGRLTPCEHVFCLDCARSDSMCYLCDDRIQKIQTIKLMEGIFICAAPHCLKSFLKKTEFESHIHGSHSDLLQPNTKKEEVNESDAFSIKPSAAASESSAVRAPQKPGFPPSSTPPLNDREDTGRSQQSREQTPLRPLIGSQHYLEASSEKSQQVYYQHPPNFAVPIINPGPNRPPFYRSHMNMEVTRSDSSTPDHGPGSADAAPPGFSEPHAHSWGTSSGGGGIPFEAMQLQEMGGDGQARGAFFRGDYGRNSSSSNSSQVDSRDGNGIGIGIGIPPPPPPGPIPPHLLQQKQDYNYSSADQTHDYCWSQHKRDGFGSS